MAKPQVKATESADEDEVFGTYFGRLFVGTLSTTCIFILGLVLRYLFGDQIGSKIRLIVLCILHYLAGLVHLRQNIGSWMQHDGPNAPFPSLKEFCYFLPSILVSVDFLYWIQALKAVLPALTLGFLTYLAFGTMIYDYTGLCKWSNDLMEWLFFKKLGAKNYILVQSVFASLAASKYSVSFSMPVCKLLCWTWPSAEEPCSKLPFFIAVIPIVVLLVPIVVWGQHLKTPFRGSLRHCRIEFEPKVSAVRLGQLDYQYESLKPGFIRVLDVLPPDSILGSYINTRIRHIRLQDAKYDAISYTWGNPVKSKGILIDGKWCSVTENAFEVIRDRVCFSNTRTIWIDCICIDQQDDQEKTRQVGMMSEIYRRADRAIVWLGDVPDAMLAFSLMEDFCRRVKKQEASGGQEYQFRPNNAARTWLFGVYNRFDPRFCALARLLGHPYFRRLWVIQEITFAQEVHLHCRDCWINWSDFEWAVLLLINPRYRDLVGSDKVMWSMQRPAVLSQIQQISSYRHKLKGNDASDRLPLGVILAETSIAEASDTRDLVYGLLSMSKAGEDPNMAPDYTIDTPQVFKNTAKYLLTNSELEDILYGSGVGYPRQTSGIPSWIPDWACQSRVNRLRKKGVFIYNASNGRTQVIQAPDSETILMRGITFDKISVMSSRSFTTENPDIHSSGCEEFGAEMLFLELEIRELAERLPDVYINGYQSRQEALWRTRVADRTRNLWDIKPGVLDKPTLAGDENRKGNYDWPAQLDRFIDALKAYEQVFSMFKDAGVTRRSFHTTGGEYSPEMALLQLSQLMKAVQAKRKKSFVTLMAYLRDYFEAMCLTSAGRRFAITEKGYMALVPPLSQAGDKVCILFNMDVPFILRQVSESTPMDYQIVGESYVHGIMDGEACRAGSLEVDFRIV
ncbi:Heterokaryon incompatibility protein, putative [Glarea lozoyensis ATCC 20868]|uniref:Heterokaryon incompatibility protein, putative n=1 Tax=Glarea lozoyensis (strain ATCC 20868 / MF5171) TaxID=1116229 RepID=S3CV39_GLAL2|nr:Heterokaryon incompatibility protein, putative [Glarea lozoyensis ATCC 20868]EPE28819.1 Heterokaryon incompatibility protein, putative [Glarea lozoyensis ATCC 20868]